MMTCLRHGNGDVSTIQWRVLTVAGYLCKIDPGQWPTIGTQEPAGADRTFDK